MLLPAFLSYAFSSPRTLLMRTLIFYLGLSTTLLPLGVLAGTAGAFVNAHRFTFVAVAAVVVIVLGALMLLNVPLPFLSRGGALESTGPASVYALGAVYGLAGVCAGPFLGAVQTVAAVSGDALYGGVVLVVFAAGMALPLFVLVLALAWGRMPFVQRLVRPREVRIGRWRNTWTGVIGGLLTVGLGILLIVTNGTSSLGGVLGASTQVQLEGWAYQTTSIVPDWVIAVAVAAAALTAWLVVRRRSGRARTDASTARGDALPSEGVLHGTHDRAVGAADRSESGADEEVRGDRG